MSLSATTRRIQKEIAEIGRNPSEHWKVVPVDDDMYEWHFTVFGPEETDFEGGRYHGRICLPNNYPFAPPSIMLLTPNGRFEINKKICLSVSNFHPELWQPAWGIRTILEALRSFFPTPPDGAVGALDWPPHVRRKIAAEETADWRCDVCKATNAEILPMTEKKAKKEEEKVETDEVKAEAENEVSKTEERVETPPQEGVTCDSVKAVPCDCDAEKPEEEHAAAISTEPSPSVPSSSLPSSAAASPEPSDYNSSTDPSSREPSSVATSETRSSTVVPSDSVAPSPQNQVAPSAAPSPQNAPEISAARRMPENRGSTIWCLLPTWPSDRNGRVKVAVDVMMGSIVILMGYLSKDFIQRPPF